MLGIGILTEYVSAEQFGEVFRFKNVCGYMYRHIEELIKVDVQRTCE